MQTTDSSPFTLNPGERLLWSGRPIADRIVRRRGIFLILIGAVIVAKLIQTVRSMERSGALDAPPLIILVVMTVALLAAGPLATVMRMRRTAYAITSERLLMINTIVSRFVKAFPLETITDIALAERGDGSGDIAIGRRFLPPGWQDPRLMTSGVGRNGLLNIPDAKRVHAILLATRAARLAAVA